MATIFVTRRLPNGALVLGAFLVDVWGIGLKDAWGRVEIGASEFREMLDRQEEVLGHTDADLDEVRHLVFGGIRRARELGFRLPSRYERWTAILGELPEDVEPDMSLFGHDGKVCIIGNVNDLRRRRIGGRLEDFLTRPDVSFILGPDDIPLVDEAEEAVAEGSSRLSESLIPKIQQWCFAQGEAPSPMLATVVDAAVEAIAQAAPPELAETPEAAEQAGEDGVADLTWAIADFIGASAQGNEEEAARAFAQFGRYMSSFDSPEEFLEIVGIDLEGG